MYLIRSFLLIKQCVHVQSTLFILLVPIKRTDVRSKLFQQTKVYKRMFADQLEDPETFSIGEEIQHF